MSEELIKLLNNFNEIQNIKIEYSSKSNILIVFLEKKIYIIDNIIEKPKIRVKLDINFIPNQVILHPKNENQMLILSETSILIITDLTKVSKIEKKNEIKIPIENKISIKFSFFDNCFGVLYKDRTFIYYLFKEEENKLEKICEIKEFDTDYIDFNFCPLFSKGFEIFMIFFMTKNGALNMYGPFFPNEFFISKQFIFNMENYFIYKLGLIDNKKNNQENTIYCLSLNVINDLKKSIIKDNSDKDNNFIKISDKMKIFNSSFRKREINIHNNFLLNNNGNNDNEILDKRYKQIHILNNRPLTIMRIANNNNIDLIILGEEIMPLELAQTGNFDFIEENNINNFFIEFIKLNNKEEKEKLKINQYNNEEIFVQTKNNLFLIKIPYLNKLKIISEEKLKDIPNKINKTNIIKLFKWDNDKNKNKEKSIYIGDILIVPDLKKLYVFGVLKEKEMSSFSKKDKLTLKIKEKDYSEEEKKSEYSNFKNILTEKTEYDNQIDEIKSKLKENDFIDSSDLKKCKIVLKENSLNDDFENQVNEQMNIIYKVYKDLIQNNDEIFHQKINIMKIIYNNLSKSQIKLAVDETIIKINKLKDIKKEIDIKKKIIEAKIESVKDKINKYELTDNEINNYLDFLKKYQIEIGEKLNSLNQKIEFYENNIGNIFSFIELFPNFDLDFNLIEKENQTKYLIFEKKIANNSKSIDEALSKII